METLTPKIKYTLREKYFQIGPENRIRRYQYFVRSLMPAILFFLISIILMGVLASTMGLIFSGRGFTSIILSFVGSVLMYSIGFIVAKNNVLKRCHDFGNDGSLAIKIVMLSFGMAIFMSLINLLGSLGILPTVNPEDVMKQALSSGDGINIFTNMMKTAWGMQPLYLKILGIINPIVSIISLVLWLFLLFRRGNPGENTYGPSPVNTKIGFLG